MATIDMAGEAKPFFHDFLGMTPNGDPTKQQQEIAGFRIRNGSRHVPAYAQPDLDGETSVKSSSRAVIDICAENSVCSAPARLTGGPSLAFADPSCSSRDSGAESNSSRAFWLSDLGKFRSIDFGRV